MRIIAIGLGGAGCRIVESLYATDRRSSRVACVQPLAIDINEESMKALSALPDSAKLCFPENDPGLTGRLGPAGPSATIDIAEILARIHNLESGENDAIIVCLGLGGGMADVAPHIITGLRSSITESVFALVTLPCLAEGERRSARAADQIDTLSPILDGMILFDNETWYKKTKALREKHKKKEKGLAERLGLAKEEPQLTGEHATYHHINEAIVRRIALILKAGEFRADGGIESAEVVLDSGEVLNTMKGMGFITIGYAVERLPSNPLSFLAQFRPQGQGIFDEEKKKRASRIVDLAKQAIYHEISTPCDMTSAHKALVLIAGPSHELSMKGFMTVRKWIDRSIAGLEMRSGDYPVMNTKNVAIIVMLSGLENIPRVSELCEIRAQHHAWSQRQGADAVLPGGAVPARMETAKTRDDMIVIPALKVPEAASLNASIEDVPLDSRKPEPEPARAQHHARIMEDERKKPAGHSSHKEPDSGKPVLKSSTPHHLSKDEVQPQQPSRTRVVTTPASPHARSPSPRTEAAGPIKDTPDPRPRLSLTSDKDAARQRIELELQRQRLKAISGRHPAADDAAAPPPPHDDTPKEPVQKRQTVRIKTAAARPSREPIQSPDEDPAPRTVIIPRKKVITRSPDPAEPENLPVPDLPDQEIVSGQQEATTPEEDTGIMTVDVRDTPFRAKDHVFGGRDVRKPAAGTVKDTPLIHTNLAPKKMGHKGDNTSGAGPEPDEAGPSEKKPDKRRKRPDDLSWI